MWRRNVNVILITAMLIQLSGCTAIGYSVGSLYDNHHGSVREMGTPKVVTVPEGRPVHLTLSNGDTLSGVVFGRSRMPLTDYVRWFEEYKKRTPVADQVPAIGDSVRVATSENRGLNFKFNKPFCTRIVAYDPDTLYVSDPKDTSILPIVLRDIRLMESMDGRIYSRNEILQNLLQQRPPVPAVLHVRTTYGMKTVPVSDIRAVKAWQRNRKGRITGALIGVPIDCFLIIMVIALSQLNYTIGA